MNEYLTEEGFKKLKEELYYLKTVKRKEIAEQLKHAASFGDLSENAAYDEAKNAQAFLEKKIADLEDLLKRAKIIKNDSKKDKVQIGSTVTIVNISNNEQEKFIIVGSTESDPFSGKISTDSLIGKKLLNLKEGDKFTIETPDGVVEYKILKIE
jgi:transcription elongation factor GreA